LLHNSPEERSSQPIYELQAQYKHSNKDDDDDDDNNNNNNNASNDNDTGKFPVDAAVGMAEEQEE
jgi:hypothetical protein